MSQELRTKCLPGAEKCPDFRECLSSRNKAKNAGSSSKNAGMQERSQHAGFSARLRDG